MEEVTKDPARDETSGTDGESEETLRRAASIVESLLLVSARPLPLEKIGALTGVSDRAQVRRLVALLKEKYAPESSGILVEEVSRGLQLRTNPANQEHVRKLFEARPARFTRASLETLAVVAYRQPVTRLEIEQIRGVDCAGALRTLMDRRLVKVTGKKDVPGRPFLFGTTREFLEVFGLNALSDLPSMRDIEDFLESATGALAPRAEGASDVSPDPSGEPETGEGEDPGTMEEAEHGEPLVVSADAIPEGVSDDVLVEAASRSGVIYVNREGLSVPGPTRSKYELGAGFQTFEPAEPLVTDHDDLPEGLSDDAPEPPED
ncbi:MAG: hypothetical protein Kow00128_13550 [Deltaproteobacteria bacterium]